VCVQAAINGFEITFYAPSRTFSADNEGHGTALMKLLMDLSNVHQRFKSVTHLVEYPQEQGSVASVEYAMKVCSISPDDEHAVPHVHFFSSAQVEKH
jgi:hypothetical protein